MSITLFCQLAVYLVHKLYLYRVHEFCFCRIKQLKFKVGRSQRVAEYSCQRINITYKT